MIRSLKPFIPGGEDFATSRQFFLDLGFAINWEVEGLAELQLGEGAFLLQDFQNKDMQENLMIQVSVEDLDAWWAQMKASGILERYPTVRVAGPKDFPWGNRELHLVDPAGVCWHFM